MPRARLRAGRQAQEIGAAIVESWFKILPTPATIISVDSTAPLVITIDRRIFGPNIGIAIRPPGPNGNTERNLKVGTASDVSPYSQKLTILQAGTPYSYSGDSLVTGSAIPDTPDQAMLQSELETVLGQIIDATTVRAVYDTETLVNIAIPKIPDKILTPGDLLKYLQGYHDYGQGRHYHDELGVAVLFGCR